MVSIAIDAMGGDAAPQVVLEGAVQALDRTPSVDKLLLVGPREKLQSGLAELGQSEGEHFEIVHTDEYIEMDEPAASAIRRKKKASINVAASLVKEGRADGLFSAGHTGAAVAATVLKLRTLPGILRPGIATVFPSPTGPFLLIDAGANVDCKPQHLIQYGVMGDIYAREILGMNPPRVGLLNVGHEAGKGNELTKETYNGLASLSGLNFVGNVEGRDIFADKVDVVICDGFVGNVVLKSCESLGNAFGHFIKKLLMKNMIRRLGALLAKNAFTDLKKLADYAEYGGAPLLGVKGVCIIGHGSSTAPAIANAIRVAGESVEHHINDHIVERIDELSLSEPAQSLAESSANI
ncbi:MAG: phosphate acyltransferase PlsX [Lentisphaeria bacterium]